MGRPSTTECTHPPTYAPTYVRGLMASVVQGHMFPLQVTFRGTEMTVISLPELSGAHPDAVGVLTNPADHLSGCGPGLGAMSAHRPGSQNPHRVTHPELMRCGLWSGLGSHGVLLLELLANLPGLLPRKAFLGIHCHAIT